MAMFRLTGPDGAAYDVTAPDENAAAAAFGQLNGQSQPPQPAAANPFNRQMGSDVSYGAPLGVSSPVDETQYRSPDESSEGPSRSFATDARAFTSQLPLADQAAALGRTYLPSFLGGNDQGYSANLADVRASDTAAQQAAPLAAMAGKTAGMLPYLAAPEIGAAEGLAGRMAGSTATGATVGAAQGAAGSDWSDPEATARNALAQALAGGVIGGAVPLAAAGLGKIASPFGGRISPQRQAMADAIKAEGIDLSAGQQTGNKTLLGVESALSDVPGGGGGAAKLGEAQNQQFTQAALGRAGVTPSGSQTGPLLATPEVMANANAELAARYQGLASRNAIVSDPQLTYDLSSAVKNYQDLVPIPAPGIGKLVDAINSDLSRGSMPGDTYQATRSMLSKQAQSLRFSDPPQAQAARDIRDALDSAMERSISPGDAGAWAQVNRDYGNLKDIGKAVGGAGEQGAQGIVTPAALRTAIASGNNRLAYARGQGDFADLSHAGNAMMTRFPQSGTTPRAYAIGLADALAAGAGHAIAGNPGAAAGLALGAAVPPLAGRAIMSRPVQSWLVNQRFGGMPANTNALAAALAAGYTGGQR